MIDRPVRPLFPEGYSHETQVIAMVLSADPESDPGILAIIGAGAALAISDIPFHHLLGAVRVGLVNGKPVANPGYEDARSANVNIVVAGSEQGIVMVEAGAQEVSEAEMVDAIEYGHQCCIKVAEAIRQLQQKVGKPKRTYTPREMDMELYARLESALRAELTDALDTKKHPKLESYHMVHTTKKKAIELAGEERKDEAAKLFDMLKERIFRDEMLKDRRRPDGRAFDEIRAINCEVGVLPRTHGSALFTRGETQALVTVTLGTKEDEQRVEMFDPSETSKRFMLHYNFPPFSVGEVGFMRGPGRREIGHGALAERSLTAVIPDEKTVPVHVASSQRHSRVERIELDGYGLRRDAGLDGCGGSDGNTHRGNRHGSGEGRRRLRDPDRHRRRGRPLRRHGLQGGRIPKGHHRPADGHQGPECVGGTDEGSAGTGAQSPAVYSGQNDQHFAGITQGDVAVRAANLHADRFRPTRSAN